MVTLLVIATILVFIGIELLRQHAVKHRPVPAANSANEHILIPKGYFLSKAHVWVEMIFRGEARIGMDDFIQKIIGGVDRIESVKPGTELKKGEPLLTVYSGSRTLTIPAPLSGTVTKLNEAVLALPKALQTDPYVSCWIAVLMPKNIAPELLLLSVAQDTGQWMKAEIARFRDFIRTQTQASQTQTGVPAAIGVTLFDGGLPHYGVLGQFDENTWRAFQKEFLKAE
ncbi:MAG: glycine cleavage system protein H [Bacteroidota bacterium]